VSGIVGLIPAAGKAERIDGLPKFLLPSKDGFLLEELCDRMLAGGAEQILIGANPENRAIIERYAPKEAVVYSVNTSNMSQTLLAARTWCGDRTVLFGMPDTYWTPKYIFDGMLSRLDKLPVIAACWQARDDQLIGKLGMVRIENKFLDKSFEMQVPVISDVVDKPNRVIYKSVWGALAWKPEFWDCVQPGDAHIGYAMQRALARQMIVGAAMQPGSYWDCGTRAEYFRLARFF
jgi:UTP-glucose-1-phosphate uridylyltransferase